VGSVRILTDERCLNYGQAGHPERPGRISETLALLKKQPKAFLSWGEPPEMPMEESISRAHTEFHQARLGEGVDFDPDTPAYPNIEDHAHRSVAAALGGLDHVLNNNEPAFSLMRPPGHHATRERAMGFCYLNQAAICALEARVRGIERVAVLDFDVHHGNGTEDILKGREGTWVASIHQHPCYPGTGTESFDNILNYPVLPLTPRQEHMEVIRRGLDAILRHKPGLLIVSAGFDAYVGDPISDECLEVEDFHQLGFWVGGCGIPHLHILEGGYSKELPQCIAAYLEGLRCEDRTPGKIGNHF